MPKKKDSKLTKAEARAKKEEEKRKQQGKEMQDLNTDHISLCGRFVSMLNCVIIAFFVASVATDEWSFTEALGHDAEEIPEGGFGGYAGRANFGLDKLCIEVPIANWNNGTFPVCYSYDDNIQTCDEAGTSCVSMKASKRFSKYDDGRGKVQIVLWLAIGASFFGSAFSERLIVLLISQGLSALFGIITVALWGKLQKETNDSGISNDELKLGFSAILAIAGIITSVVSLAMGIVDFLHGRGIRCCHDDDNEEHASVADIQNDGIKLQTGRLAALLATAVWILFLIKATDPEWSETDRLGNAGDFCLPQDMRTPKDDILCENRRAEFGLWRFCVEETVDYLGGRAGPNKNPAKPLICLSWNQVVTVTGQSSSQNGNDRFGDASSSTLRQTVAGTMLGAILLAAAADVYSEKLLPSAIMCISAGVCGIAAMGAWVKFQDNISKYAKEDLRIMGTFALIIVGWMVALVAGVLYLNNYEYWRRQYAGRQPCLPELCYSGTCGQTNPDDIDRVKNDTEPEKKKKKKGMEVKVIIQHGDDGEPETTVI
eukprot:m.339130 g.339130  ORF g.339130 m.339130 type:complete len:543 (-) comp18680_c0_seq1:141-1769(-)